MADVHYGPAGEFLWRGKKLGICALDGAKDFVYDVGSLAAASRFCKNCITKHGATNLRRDANIALKNAKRTVDGTVQELKLLQEKYAARFNTTIKWVTKE